MNDRGVGYIGRAYHEPYRPAIRLRFCRAVVVEGLQARHAIQPGAGGVRKRMVGVSRELEDAH